MGERASRLHNLQEDMPKRLQMCDVRTNYPSNSSIQTTHRLCPPPKESEQSVYLEPDFSPPKEPECGEEGQQGSPGYCEKEEQEIAAKNKKARLDREYEANRTEQNEDPAYSVTSPSYRCAGSTPVPTPPGSPGSLCEPDEAAVPWIFPERHPTRPRRPNYLPGKQGSKRKAIDEPACLWGPGSSLPGSPGWWPTADEGEDTLQ